MNAKDILKSILESKGPITITESDMDESKGKSVGMIETWDDTGNRSWTIYAHEGPKKK